MIHGQKFQNLIGLRLQRALFLCDAFASKPSVPEGFPGLATGHHHQVFADGHGAEFMGDLEGAQQPFVKQFMWRHASDIFTCHGHPARGGRQNARDHVK